MATLGLILCGCASSGVVPLDNGIYYISKEDVRVGIGPPSSETITSVYKEANNFCSKKDMEVKSINGNFENSGPLKSSVFSLEFKCVNSK